MMLYKNKKAMGHSPDGDIDLFKKKINWHHVYILPRLRTSIDLIKKWQEADNILQKLWQMQTMQMIWHFTQIQQPQP